MRPSLGVLEIIAACSDCERRQYAAVALADKTHLWGVGYNRIQLLEALCSDCKRDSIPHNTQVEHCYALHAEQMALNRLLSAGIRPTEIVVAGWEGGKLVDLTKFPCTVCARAMLDAGVRTLTTFDSHGCRIQRPAVEAWREAYAMTIGLCRKDENLGSAP